MITYCWTVVRHVAPRIHRHLVHLAHRSGKIFHHLAKFAHHSFTPTMLVCRALPLALAGAGLLNIAPTEPPGHPVASPAYVQSVPQGQFVAPYQPSGLPSYPSPFACCGVQFQPPSDPGTKVPLPPPVTDPWPNGDPPGDPPGIIVTTSVDPDPGNSVDEPSSGIVVLGGLASLLLLRKARGVRT